jgi:hypothetical protein
MSESSESSEYAAVNPDAGAAVEAHMTNVSREDSTAC